MLDKNNLATKIKQIFDINDKTFAQYQKKATENNYTIVDFLTKEKIIDDKKLYQAIAKELDYPFFDISSKEIKKDILNLVPAPLAQTHQIIAFDKKADEIYLATIDPEDIQTIEFIRRKTGLEPKIFVTNPSNIKNTLHRYHANLEDDTVITKLSEKKNKEDKDLKKQAEELPIINIVNSILEHAIYEGASDIHIEPTEKELSVRYRIDGILHDVMSLPKNVQEGIIARIKILSKLKIDEHMKPQDGRFKIKVQDEALSFRVSILPVYDGEKIVMRVLHEGSKPLSLDELGFLPKAKAKVKYAIAKPHGTVLVTGPTGSGKTTTLYSILGILNTKEVNISTIEDPIEYHVDGINQSQVNSKIGYDFASGLRAFLRQDPDIIMVGEIRDEETAEIAIHAAMTGHLVLSTLHTNDAPTTLPRLADMNVPPFLLGFTTNIIIAQRLVRKICEKCKAPYTLSETEIKELEKNLENKNLKDLLKENKMKTEDEKISSATFYRGQGCNHCQDTGYKGRIGIYEVLDMDEGLVKKINEHANADDIKKYALEQGMTTMFEDGLIKSLKGITTIEEILRATRE